MKFFQPRFIYAWFCLLTWLLFFPEIIFANNPGGFSTLVTAPVTTGTETYNGHTDHYLDNGILHVLIENNGSVESIHYLKPGLAGTPEANGTEMVSQSGANFGNHTAIYYYWYPDGNGDCVYSNTVANSTNIDVCYFRPFTPANGDQVIADVELHYALGKGNTGLYAYLIFRHPSSYVSYATNLNISFIQCIYPTAHDTTNFLCENQYVDSNVKYGLFLNGVQQARNGLQPNFYDNWHTIGVTNMPKEILQYTTGQFAGCTNGKYSFTFDYPKLSTFGMASDTNKLGLWVVAGGHEYQQNGPTACEYSGGIGGIVTFEPLIAHYGNTGLTVSSNANWSKFYGPWLFYFNSQSNGAACWADSQQQALAEQSAWPYAWLTNSLYQSKNQRASVSGKLVISDSLRPQATAAGAWIGFAAPDSGLENDPNNWQFQSDNYQFWTQCAADGTFTLPPVTTFSPYGGAATYQLYAYCAGTNGSVGEFTAGPFTFTSGTVTNLGTLTWKVSHPGSLVLWEIGYPDRTAAKYRHGNEYGRPSLWLNFINEFTSPLEYYIASNNWATALNYCHSVDNMATSPWKWHLNFNLPSVTQGTYWLNIAYATADSYQIVRVNNDNSYVADFIPANGTPGATTYIRQGIHSKYTVAHVAIPSSQLVAGANFITLDHEYHSDHANDNFMYDYLDLEAPVAQLSWRGDGTANNWDIGISTNWFNGSSTVPYTDLSPVLFDNTGSSSPNINLTDAFQLGSVTVASDKNYTFGGVGSLYGTMALAKSGSGTLTLNTTNSFTGATTVSNGTLLVNGTLTSPVNVIGGTLGGSGSVTANVASWSGAALAPGGSVLPGTFTIANTLVTTNYTDTNDNLVAGTYFITNNLALTNNSLFFTFGSVTNLGGGANDLIQLSGGTLTLASTSTVYPQLLNGALTNGNYTLITGGNSTIGGTANLAWGGATTSTRQTFTLDTSSPGTVLLRVTNLAGIAPLTGGALVWRGTNGSAWDVATTTNWQNNLSADEFYNFDSVLFNDTSANGIVAITGTVLPGGILVSNNSRAYTISGAVGGTATLTKTGSGTLTMSSASTYSSGTIINAGTVTANNATALGSGTVTLNGGTLSLGSGITISNPITVAGTSTLVTGPNYINSIFLGGGTLNVSITGVNTFSPQVSMSSFYGTMALGSSSGFFRFYGSLGSVFAAFDLGTSTAQMLNRNGGVTIQLGSLAGGSGTTLTGASSVNAVTTYVVGGNNTSTTFAGKITDNLGATAITKTGSGTWTISGANTYSGATTITGGTLQIGSGGTSGTLGTNAVSDGGTLVFNRSDANNDAGFGLISGGGNVAQNGSGIFTFTKAQPYTGSTFINAGTLALAGSGAIASSANIILAGGSLLDASGTTGGNLSLASGQTLSGVGAVRGNVSVGSGAILSPGNPLGTLTFSNLLALASGSTSLLAVSHFPLTNDMVRVLGALTNGGNLFVTNSGSGAFAAGDSFKLFNAGNYNGSFASVTLPALAPGLAWNTSALNSAGQLSVISIVPSFSAAFAAETNLVLRGGGGLPNGNYYVLASTNLAAPIASWTRLATNAYDASGNFSFTNASGAAMNFFLLQLP